MVDQGKGSRGTSQKAMNLTDMQQSLTVTTYAQDWAQLQILQFFTSVTNDTKFAFFAVLVILVIFVNFKVLVEHFQPKIKQIWQI